MKKLMAGVLGALLVATWQPVWAGALSDAQRAEVQGLVRKTLLRDPKIVVDSLIAYRNKQMRSATRKIRALVQKQAVDILHDRDSGVLGNPKGSITLVEFMDYRCKHCRNMTVVIDDVLEHDHDLRVVVKELPIFQGVSVLAAKAAMAAKLQGRFKPYHLALMGASMPLTEEKVYRLAANVGLDVPKLKEAVASSTMNDRIARNFALARQLQIMGTPAFVVSDARGRHVVYIGGAVQAKRLREAIDEVRQLSQRG